MGGAHANPSGKRADPARLEKLSGELKLVGRVDDDGVLNIQGITEGLIVGDTLFASADGYADVGHELYRVDLSTGEVELEADFLEDGSSSPSDLVLARGGLFFQAVAETDSGDEESLLHGYRPGSGNGVPIDGYRTDPSAEGRTVTADNDFVYFAADPDGAVGQGLYRVAVASGIAAVTRLTDPVSKLDPTDVHHLTWFNGKLYFGGEAAGYGDDLFARNPATGRLSAVGVIAPGPSGDMLVADNVLYYVGAASASSHALYALTATGYFPSKVFDLETIGAEGAAVVGAFDGDIYLTVDTASRGAELYRFDPSDKSLEPAATSIPGTGGDFALTVVSDAFVF